jgi:hypothetical protein
VERGVARCPSCSQNAHGGTVLEREKSASRRARGWAGENVARSKGQPRPFPLREFWGTREGLIPRTQSKAPRILAWLGDELGESKRRCAQVWID